MDIYVDQAIFERFVNKATPRLQELSYYHIFFPPSNDKNKPN